jgi:uncharacterized protein
VRTALSSAGVSVLENEIRRWDTPEGPIAIVGLADTWTRTPELGRTLAAVPLDVPTFVLVHEPDIFPEVPPRVAVTFAAHTHGGQVSLPLLGALIVPSRFGKRYAAGHVNEGGRDLFVTTGIGTSILPVRFGVAPEVAIVTIRAH